MIALCVPTRGRPSLFADMVSSAFNTADVPSQVYVVAYVADDDPCGDAYDDVAIGHSVSLMGGPHIWNTQAWNLCARHAIDAGADICMQAADDLVFRTQGWDTWLDETFRTLSDPYWLVHCADGSPHDQPAWREYIDAGSYHAPFAAHVILHRDWIDALGCLVPEAVPSTFCDVWVNELADRLGRRQFLPDVLIEHAHHYYGKRRPDSTDQLRKQTDRAYQPERIYADTTTRRYEDLRKLQAAIGRGREHAHT